MVLGYPGIQALDLVGPVEVFTGARADRLRPTGDSFKIASRTVYLDHTTVLANNLNLFL